MPEISPKKLHRAIRNSDKRLEPFRTHSRLFWEEYTGPRYYTDDRGVRKPINLLQRAIDTLVAHLATHSPEHDITTELMHLRPAAAVRSLMLDKDADETDLVSLSRRALMDAFMSPGARVKLGIRAGSDTVKVQGRTYPLGQPYAILTDLDDLIFDPAARNHDEKLFEGDYIRIPRDVAMDSGLFDERARRIIERLPSIGDGPVGERRDAIEEMTQGSISRHDRYDLVDLIELADITLYDEGLSHRVMMPSPDGGPAEFLRIEQWEGPERGPYEWLGFKPVRNQPFWLPLAAQLIDQDEVMLAVLAKLVDQVMRTKRVLAYRKQGGEDDAMTIRDAEDGAVIGIDGDPTEMLNADFGGVSPEFAPFVQMLLGWSNIPMGNMDMLSGSPPGKPSGGSGGRTATEFAGLLQSVTVLVDDLQRTHEAFHDRIARHKMWHYDSDPLISKPLLHRLPGGEFFQVVYDAQTRSGDHADFTVKVRTRSMVYQDPHVRVRRVLELIEIVGQAAVVEMNTMGRLDAAAAGRITGRLMGIPELDELLRDPILQQELAMKYAGMPPQGQGRVEGPGEVNPEAVYRARPSTPEGVQRSAYAGSAV